MWVAFSNFQESRWYHEHVTEKQISLTNLLLNGTFERLNIELNLVSNITNLEY